MEILDTLRFNLRTLSDVETFLPVFLPLPVSADEEARELLKREESRDVLQAFRDAATREGKIPYGEWVGIASRKTGKRGKALFLPLRAALTGSLSGPELERVYGLLSPDIVLLRLERAVSQGQGEKRNR